MANSPQWNGVLCGFNASGVCAIRTNCFGYRYSFWQLYELIHIIGTAAFPCMASAKFAGGSTRPAYTVKDARSVSFQRVAAIWLTTALPANPLTKAFRAPLFSTRSIALSFCAICAVTKIASMEERVSKS